MKEKLLEALAKLAQDVCKWEDLQNEEGEEWKQGYCAGVAEGFRVSLFRFKEILDENTDR